MLWMLWTLLAGIPCALAFSVLTHFHVSFESASLLWVVPPWLLLLAGMTVLFGVPSNGSRWLDTAVRATALLPTGVLLFLFEFDASPEWLPFIGIVVLVLLPFMTPLRWNFIPLLLVLPVLIGSVFYQWWPTTSLMWFIGLHLLGVSLVSRVCIGNLVKTAPKSDRYREWLVVSSTGSGLCLLLAQTVPPLIFEWLLDYPITESLAWVVCVVVRVMRDRLEPGE